MEDLPPGPQQEVMQLPSCLSPSSVGVPRRAYRSTAPGYSVRQLHIPILCFAPLNVQSTHGSRLAGMAPPLKPWEEHFRRPRNWRGLLRHPFMCKQAHQVQTSPAPSGSAPEASGLFAGIPPTTSILLASDSCCNSRLQQLFQRWVSTGLNCCHLAWTCPVAAVSTPVRSGRRPPRLRGSEGRMHRMDFGLWDRNSSRSNLEVEVTIDESAGVEPSPHPSGARDGGGQQGLWIDARHQRQPPVRDGKAARRR